ncbi:MAG TPA: DNA-binding response regulator [Lachnospiraceae bacterium]|nr:LytTR family DNA-binding domain-containing protein [uncultured Lachnoclostridium sp.]HAU84248.1 DNA-binding response regulator [Lachnospiraceae bacterium]
MLNMLICDDSGKQIILEKKAILNYQAVKKQVLFRIQTTTNTKDALKYVASNRVDIAVLDIEIDRKTGIDVAKEILARNTACKIIFVTNYDSFAYSAFEIEAFAYLLKPFEESRLCEQLDKIMLELQKEQLLERYGGSKLEMKFKGTTSCVRQEDILYIEKKGKNVVVVTDEQEYEYTDNLKDLEKKLDTERFIRCHNGFIVNVNRIVSYRRTEVYVGEEEICIPVSKANTAKVVNAMEKRLWENVL